MDSKPWSFSVDSNVTHRYRLRANVGKRKLPFRRNHAFLCSQNTLTRFIPYRLTSIRLLAETQDSHIPSSPSFFVLHAVSQDKLQLYRFHVWYSVTSSPEKFVIKGFLSIGFSPYRAWAIVFMFRATAYQAQQALRTSCSVLESGHIC
jgi:hypothetical protein